MNSRLTATSPASAGLFVRGPCELSAYSGRTRNGDDHLLLRFKPPYFKEDLLGREQQSKGLSPHSAYGSAPLRGRSWRHEQRRGATCANDMMKRGRSTGGSRVFDTSRQRYRHRLRRLLRCKRSLTSLIRATKSPCRPTAGDPIPERKAALRRHHVAGRRTMVRVGP